MSHAHSAAEDLGGGYGSALWRWLVRATQDSNGWLIRTIAVGACGLVVVMVGAALGIMYGGMRANSETLASIERRLAVIEVQVGALSDDR